MRAWRTHRRSIDSPSLDEVQRPTPGPDQMLILVAAACLNWLQLCCTMKDVLDVPMFTPRELISLPPTNQLLAQFHFDAKSYCVKGGKPTMEVSNLKYAMRPLAQLYGPTLINDFGPLRLKAVRDAMIAEDYSRRHINERVNRIRRTFRWV